MKVVIIGKGEMLSNLIEGTLSAGCEIVGVLRYEKTVMPPLLLKLRDFFKTSYTYEIFFFWTKEKANLSIVNGFDLGLASLFN